MAAIDARKLIDVEHGLIGPFYSDACQRNFYRHWAELMEAE